MDDSGEQVRGNDDYRNQGSVRERKLEALMLMFVGTVIPVGTLIDAIIRGTAEALPIILVTLPILITGVVMYWRLPRQRGRR